ncbi:hypothetical protein PGB90_008269 [Kerria lacca]
MDSNSKITSESNHFIMDLGSKSVRSCFSNESQVTFQKVSNNSVSPTRDNSTTENNFSNCNGSTKLVLCETLNSRNRDEIVSVCDKNSHVNLNKENSSQSSLIFGQNSICDDIENDLLNLNVTSGTTNKRSELICKQRSDYNNSKCDKTYVKGENSQVIKNKSDNKQNPDILENSLKLRHTGQITEHTEPQKDDDSSSEVLYISYESENQMPDIMKLIQKDLSEPYSIYTYRYFIHNWPHLCFLAVCKGKSVGAIVCKLDLHRKIIKRGYIAMLAVDESCRKQGIGSNLVIKAIRVMAREGADEVVLETEITNQPALRLYENLGFVRDKRLFRYYLNGVDALRLKLWLR